MNKVTIVRFNYIIEDEVTISSGETELICVAPNGLGAVNIGETYPAALYIHALDQPFLRENPEGADDKIERIDDTYSYEITGNLINERIISCGFELEASFITEIPQRPLKNKITIRADRLEVYFHPNNA